MNSGHLEVVKYLVQQRSDVDAVDYNRRTALHLPACKGN